MYRIRTAAGSEASYNSLEEFTAAVRRGAVIPEDEIFHTRANRWLDVKSHPHYRSAIAGTTPAPPTTSAAASQPSPSVRPAPSPAASPAAGPSQSRAAVFERPVLPPVQQTVLHPRLQADSSSPRARMPAPAPHPAPHPTRYAPPVRSKELTFVDVEGVPSPARPRAVAEHSAPAPVTRTELKPAKPAPLPKEPDPELDFLIMDGGIESPVRNSAGFKTVPEELELLFDPTSPEPNGHPASPASATGQRSGKRRAIVIAALDSTPISRPPAASTPVPTEPIDLDVPGGALLSEPAPAPAPQSWATGQKTNYLGGGIALLVIVAGLLAWRPWHGGPRANAAAGMGADTAQLFNSRESSLVTLASATTPLGTLAGAALTPPRPEGAKPTPDPGLAEGETTPDEVIVAARADFSGGVPIATSISLGAVESSAAPTPSVAPSELVRRLVAAQREAHADLTTRLNTIGFRGVINPARLGTPALVAAARTAWSGGVDAIRSYRARIAKVEKAYEDSVLTAQRSQRWSGQENSAWAMRQSLAESSETSQLADLMFAQVGEGLEILAALPGEYTIKGDRISFKNATSATRYASIRGWVEQRVANWSATPEGARPYSVSATLRALSEGFPAVE